MPQLKPELAALAERRHNLHTGQASHRPLSEDYELIGLAGEAAFAERFGLPLDAADRPAGDKGVDFTINGYTVDVKTARKPYNLLIEKTKAHQAADILVLARYDDETQTATLIGWTGSDSITEWRTVEFIPGIVNYAKPARELQPMAALEAFFAADAA